VTDRTEEPADLDGDIDRLLREFDDAGWEGEYDKQLALVRAAQRADASVEPDAIALADGSASGGRPELGPHRRLGLTEMWLDDVVQVFKPIVRPGRVWTARLMAMFFNLFIASAVGWLVVPEFWHRVESRGDITIKQSVLTAQPVTLATREAAIVEEIYVDVQTLSDAFVAKGTRIAKVRKHSATEDGGSIEYIVAPFDARFVSINAPVGTVTQPLSPVATVYDPTKMMVIATIRIVDLDRFRRGMTVDMHATSLDRPIKGIVDSAVPLLGTEHDPATQDLINIRILPDVEAVQDLVPGINLRLTVHTDSADEDAPRLLLNMNSD
jgi:HlyD family secretion protein